MSTTTNRLIARGWILRCEHTLVQDSTLFSLLTPRVIPPPISLAQSDQVGDAIADKKFDLSTYEAQLSVLNLCDTIGAKDTGRIFVGEIDCFMYDFVDYLNSTGQTFASDTASQLSSVGFQTYLLMKTLTYFNVGMDYNTGIEFDDDGNAVFAFVGVNTTMPLKLEALTLVQYREFLDEWESWVDAHNKDNPSTQVSQFCVYWYFLIAGEAIVSTTMSGISISLVFAFCVLVIANKNWLIAIIAMAPIFVILIAVALMMVALGVLDDAPPPPPSPFFSREYRACGHARL